MGFRALIVFVAFCFFISAGYAKDSGWSLKDGSLLVNVLTDEKTKAKITITAFPEEHYATTPPEDYFKKRILQYDMAVGNVFKEFDISKVKGKTFSYFTKMRGYQDRKSKKRLAIYYAFFIHEYKVSLFFRVDLDYNLNILSRVISKTVALAKERLQPLMPPPPGWKAERKKGFIVFTRQGLRSGEVLQFTLHDPANLAAR